MMAKVKRFREIHSERSALGSTKIFVDTSTGVNYLFHYHGYGGGLTPLLDADGHVVVTPVSGEGES